MTRPVAERPDATAGAVATTVRHDLVAPGTVLPAEQYGLIHATVSPTIRRAADTPPEATGTTAF